MMATTTETPRVWVGCLACYNAGRLVGEWVDASEAAEFVPCKRSEYGSPHEEWWVFDFEGFQGFLSSECSPMEAQRLAELIDEIEAEGYPVEAVATWADQYTSGEVDLGAFADAFMGEWETFRAYSDDFIDSTGFLSEVPEDIARYFNFQQYADEMESSYNVVPAPDGGVYVFLA